MQGLSAFFVHGLARAEYLTRPLILVFVLPSTAALVSADSSKPIFRLMRQRGLETV